MITSLHKSPMVAGGAQILVYSTISGGIGAFAPFVSQDDVDLFQSLEVHMRTEAPPLCGRDQQAFRSYFLPVRVCHNWHVCASVLISHFHYFSAWSTATSSSNLSTCPQTRSKRSPTPWSDRSVKLRARSSLSAPACRKHVTPGRGIGTSCAGGIGVCASVAKQNNEHMTANDNDTRVKVKHTIARSGQSGVAVVTDVNRTTFISITHAHAQNHATSNYGNMRNL